MPTWAYFPDSAGDALGAAQLFTVRSKSALTSFRLFTPQGMNFLAALMLLWLPEAEAFGALALLMRERGLRDLYKTDMAMLQVLSSC